MMMMPADEVPPQRLFADACANLRRVYALQQSDTEEHGGDEEEEVHAASSKSLAQLLRFSMEQSQQQESRFYDVVDEAYHLNRLKQGALELLFLHMPGNRQTIRLLMQGMPLPATFGFPGTNGTVISNYFSFVENFHPLISAFTADLLHPFSRKERSVVFVCSVAFNFLWSEFLSADETLTNYYVFYTVKYTLTIIYAVLIRQLVICPCFYAPLLLDQRDVTAQEVLVRAGKLQRLKSLGDRLIIGLLFVHVGLVIAMLLVNYFSTLTTKWWQIFISEVINFFVWFGKFSPLFALLYPVDRAVWYQGGTRADYFRGRSVSCNRAPNYLDPNYPRCVKPETLDSQCAHLKSFWSELQRKGNMSTFNRDLEHHVDPITPQSLRSQSTRQRNNTVAPVSPYSSSNSGDAHEEHEPLPSQNQHDHPQNHPRSNDRPPPAPSHSNQGDS